MTCRKSKSIKIILAVLSFVLVLLFVCTAINDSFFANDFLTKIGLAPKDTSVREGQAEIHFIDIDQGDCTLIRTKEGNILIDTGPEYSSLTLETYLVNNGIKEIEYLIFTHAHEDHIGGEDVVFSNCKVKNVIMSDMTSDGNIYMNLLEDIEKSGTNLIIADSGQKYHVGELEMEILSQRKETYSNINNSSVVCKIIYKNTSVMMTGDAETQVEEELLENYDLSVLNCDLYKAGHHGSDTSSTDGFIKAVSPDYAVISCGKANNYGHPSSRTLEIFDKYNVTYYRTDENGTIVFISDGNRIKLKSHEK